MDLDTCGSLEIFQSPFKYPTPSFDAGNPARASRSTLPAGALRLPTSRATKLLIYLNEDNLRASLVLPESKPSEPERNSPVGIDDRNSCFP